jgi:UDP-glucose 4-epimerase
MKVLITGGGGFIGSNLVELLLDKGFEVVVVDNFRTGKRKNLEKFEQNKNLKIIELDILDLDKVEIESENYAYIFHLAALADIVPSIEDPNEYFEVNCKGTLKVLEFARKCKPKKFIYAASSSCYGIPTEFPTSEDSKLEPKYPYALTKKIGEDLVIHWGQVYNVNYISLRLFNVYGPKSRTSGTYGAVFGVFLAQKLANKPLTIVGNGEQKRDFTHVKDVVHALYLAATSDKINEIYNVGTGEAQSINKIVKLMDHQSINIAKRPGEPDLTLANSSKIRRELNWKCQIKFEVGVKDLLNGIQNWADAPVWTAEKIHDATKSWFSYLK